MGTPAVGEIVLVPFPFSDLSTSKVRPALIAGHAEFGDVILCQITSRRYSSRVAVALDDTHLVDGALRHESFLRPDKLFTASPALVIRSIARMKSEPLRAIRDEIAANFRD